MAWILRHSQCNNNTIVSEVSMIIKDTSACSLESNPEWICAWTSWPAFGCVPRGSDTASDGPLLCVILLSGDIFPWLPINSKHMTRIYSNIVSNLCFYTTLGFMFIYESSESQFLISNLNLI